MAISKRKSVLKPPVGYCHNFNLRGLWKETFDYARSRSRLLRTEHIFVLQEALPTLGLIGFIILGLLFPPTEFTFFKSIFQTTNPWFEKVLEMYLFIISLWSMVLLVKDFTPKLWLQTICAFIIQHLAWAAGYIKGLVS